MFLRKALNFAISKKKAEENEELFFHASILHFVSGKSPENSLNSHKKERKVVKNTKQKFVNESTFAFSYQQFFIQIRRENRKDPEEFF